MKNIMILLASLSLFACASTGSTNKTSHTNHEQAALQAFIDTFGERIEPDMVEVEKYPLGSAENPVRVAGPVGQRDYLSRLTCADGDPVSVFDRQGSAGIGPYGSILDIYNVICDTEKGVVEHTVYMDMYHGDYVENRPASGFKALTQHDEHQQ